MRWDTLEARLARAHEAVAGRPVAQPLPRMCQAAQSCQACPEEAQRALPMGHFDLAAARASGGGASEVALDVLRA